MAAVRWRCQSCKQPLEFEGLPEEATLRDRSGGLFGARRCQDIPRRPAADTAAASQTPTRGWTSLLSSSRPRSTAGRAVARLWLLTQAALSALRQASRSARTQHSSQTLRSSLRCGRTTLLVACADSAPLQQVSCALDLSFLVLPSPSPSPSPSASAGAACGRLDALSRIWTLASDETSVDQPMCRDCASTLRAELEAQRAEAEGDCAAYEALLQQLRAEEEAEAGGEGCEDEQLAQLRTATEAEEAALRRDLDALRCAEAALASACASARQLDAAEERHAADVEELALAQRQHADELAGVEARTRSAAMQLEALRRTHVFNDAFHIWHDGAFGTISGFRLGRTAQVAVEWEEVNAAWGQACLLLSTMASLARFTFASHALLPMGSTARVRDCARGGTYDLFGPVSALNLLAAQRFDKAQLGFLACLAEFAAFATARDTSSGVSPAFELPYPVDGDKVDGRSLRFTLNRDDKWTAALKLMLTDLKMALAWTSAAFLGGEREA